jgi:hypothetical protein
LRLAEAHGDPNAAGLRATLAMKMKPEEKAQAESLVKAALARQAEAKKGG